MCQVRCEIVDEWVGFEKMVRIKTASGSMEEVSVPADLLEEERLRVQEIGRVDDKVLVELPRETSSGAMRIWVSQDNVIEGRTDDSDRSRDTCRA